eukprot:TRINITY_DN55624_c0_g1_i1.p1 TRINITY_DN55624_c0_g1~~TRINITY_DN55624_c0_g1_i1.p1  ORF type:complete len:234 (+),score=33.10 TRINITY_DN55624_c0_g1_i1:93-704(+)
MAQAPPGPAADLSCPTDAGASRAVSSTEVRVWGAALAAGHGAAATGDGVVAEPRHDCQSRQAAAQAHPPQPPDTSLDTDPDASGHLVRSPRSGACCPPLRALTSPPEGARAANPCSPCSPRAVGGSEARLLALTERVRILETALRTNVAELGSVRAELAAAKARISQLEQERSAHQANTQRLNAVTQLLRSPPAGDKGGAGAS